MREEDHVGTSLTADEGVSVSAAPELSHAVPVDWVDPDGAVFPSHAREYLTVNELIALLERVQPENRTKPLRFSVRLSPKSKRRISLSLVTRPRFELDVVDGDKAVFLIPDKTACGLNFLFTREIAEWAVVTSKGSVIGNADQPLSEASGSVPSAAQK